MMSHKSLHYCLRFFMMLQYVSHSSPDICSFEVIIVQFLSEEWAEEVIRHAYDEFSSQGEEPKVTGTAVIGYYNVPSQRSDYFWMSYQLDRGMLVDAQYGYDRESMPRNGVITVREEYKTAVRILREEISFLEAVRTGAIHIQGPMPAVIRYRNMCHRMLRVKKLDGQTEWKRI